MSTLLSFRYKRRFVAGNGGNGMGGLRHGKDGEDVVITVPVGTQVWTGDEPPRLVADLAVAGESVLVATGGRGGGGNARFASSTNRFPVLAQAGEPGATHELRLELKLLADVGIIGAPNAGKSSLLAAVTAARPRIASYPFTTLEPVLGVVERRSESFVMVDIPGLIEGAHEGVGLGHEFLRHVERTRVLVHVVDGSTEDPMRDYRLINRELRLFGHDLESKPQITAINKVDMPEVRERVGELTQPFAEVSPSLHFISAASGEGLGALLDSVLWSLDAARSTQMVGVAPAGPEELPVLRPRPRREPVKVYRQGGVFVVDSPAAARVAAMIDERDWVARVQFYGHLKHIGVVKALEEAGIAPGDTVRVGEVEWEWG